MENKVCLNCGAEIKQIEGSREKKYCNDICRASFHQKKNKGKEPQYVRYSTFKELKDKMDILMANKAQGEPENKKTTDSHEKGKEAANEPKNRKLSDLERKDIENQIKDWEVKKCPSFMGKAEFERMKAKSIVELKSKL